MTATAPAKDLGGRPRLYASAIKVVLTANQLARVRTKAAREGVPIAQVIRDAVDTYLAPAPPVTRGGRR